MNKRYIFGIIGVLSFTISNSQTWKTTVGNDINSGNFAIAEKVLDSVATKDNHKPTLREIDSLRTVMNRIRSDFNLSPQEGFKAIKAKKKDATMAQIEDWKSKKYIEFKVIDGKEKWFRKSVRNLWLLNPDFIDKKSFIDEQIPYLNLVNQTLSTTPDGKGIRDWNTVTIKFTLDVKPNAVPEGEIIRAWLPIPLESNRQKNFKVISSSSTPTISKTSPQHTAYFEQKAVKNKPTHFEIVYSYEVGAQYVEKKDIKTYLKPYNTKSAEYIKNTSDDGSQIIITPETKALAHSIIKEETNPVEQAALIYDWIINLFPWAGARDYSTIPNLPQYVLENKHGDCGQVTLLYITLLRSIGIPAQWESGWMLHPWEINYHDWGKIYFEGIGWLPSDVSFGRYSYDMIKTFYKTGIDNYRLAANSNIQKAFDPAKNFIRSETLDNQAGEAEWKGGNLEMDKWSSHLKIIDFKKIK